LRGFCPACVAASGVHRCGWALLPALLGKDCQRRADGLAASTDAANALGLLGPHPCNLLVLSGLLSGLLALHGDKLSLLLSGRGLTLTGHTIHLFLPTPCVCIGLSLTTLGLFVGVVLLASCVTSTHG
jgi:hypothetical protein